MPSVADPPDDELFHKPGVIFDHEFEVGRAYRLDTGEPAVALTFRSGDKELSFGFVSDAATELVTRFLTTLEKIDEDAPPA